MNTILSAAFVFSLSCLLASCAGSKTEPKAEQRQQGKNLYKTLEEVSCPNMDDFRGIGIGESESEALAQARANMAQEHFAVKLKSDLDIHAQNIDGVASSRAQSSISQEAKLLNPNDAKLHHSARQDDKVGAVACMSRADFAAFYDKMMKTAVFVTGTESIQNQATEIIIPRLQTMLSENNIKVTEKQEEASHVLSIDAKVCNPRSDENFHYASACVKVTFANVETGKNEITITVNGRKEGALNEYKAGERAFRSAAAEVWAKIKDKILEIVL